MADAIKVNERSIILSERAAALTGRKAAYPGARWYVRENAWVKPSLGTARLEGAMELAVKNAVRAPAARAKRRPSSSRYSNPKGRA